MNAGKFGTGCCFVLLCASSVFADTFGSGANTFEIEFVTIGNPGNDPDTTGEVDQAGAVPRTYRIGKYEISESMIEVANTSGKLNISYDARSPNKPATSVSWFEAAKFVNWLNESAGSYHAYKFDAAGNFKQWDPTDVGYSAANRVRNTLALYFLPSLDEWYKAAYYNWTSGAYYRYPTGTNSQPDGIDFRGDLVFDAVFYDGGYNEHPNDITNVGLLSPYGTAGQGGNVNEWTESVYDVFPNQRVVRGGTWDTGLLASSHNGGAFPNNSYNYIGFRVASIVPEPMSLSLALLASICLISRVRF